MKEEAKRHRQMLPRAWLPVGCRHQPEIIRAMAYRDAFPSIKPHTELGWQSGKLPVLCNSVI